MVVEGLDPVIISKLTSQQVDHVTCIECCRYYIAPETAACGHTLCHACWKGRRVCHTCAAHIDRKALKLNLPLQALTDHVHSLANAFEKLFQVKLDEFTMDILDDLQSEDPTKHVKEWLANSENHFSAPVASSQLSEPELPKHIELSKSNIQVHISNNKTKSPDKVVKPPQPQDDWDKIEELPDTAVCEKPKENVIGPMDLEPFFFDENEYTNNNPRRSSRKRELKEDSNHPTIELSEDKNSGKNSSTNTKSLKTKQTWNSVKKMRKEFSKLNRKNKSKLNVSIEMCKKAQNASNKPKQAQTLLHTEQNFIIDDNTPCVSNNIPVKGVADDNNKNKDFETFSSNSFQNVGTEEELPQVFHEMNSVTQKKQSNLLNEDIPVDNQNKVCVQTGNKKKDKEQTPFTMDENNAAIQNKTNKKMPFIKMGALRQESTSKKENNVVITQKEVESHTLQSNTDDIEISIKIGNMVTNILIKNKSNDVQMKVNTDKEIQTSLGPYGLVNTGDAGCSPMTSVGVQNIELNIDENSKVAVNKTISTKKNTASADTAPITTAPTQFEITDSIERELSDVMEHLERKRNRSHCLTQKKTQSVKSTLSAKSLQIPVMEKTTSVVAEQVKNINDDEHTNNAPQPEKALVLPQNKITEMENIDKDMEDIENLNDIDIFNSGSVKEANVKLLKDSKVVASEILIPTIKSKKSHKVTDKRERGESDDHELPCSKRPKADIGDLNEHREIISTVAEDKPPKDTENDSESMNYDAIMSQVFANIDADIHNSNNKNAGRTQVLKQINESQSGKCTQLESSQIIHKTQNKPPPKNVSTVGDKNDSKIEEINQKYSENVFSMLEKDSQPHEISGKKSKLPVSTNTPQNIDNLLTPAMCRELAVDTNTQIEKVVEPVEIIHATPVADNDDSESVVEETPQKNMSFTKPKQSIETAKNLTESQKQLKSNFVSTKQQSDAKTTDSQLIKSIIDISDTTIEPSKMKDTTVVEIAKNKDSLSAKDHALETPLTINKFVNHIKHNSTPVARKSLNFDTEHDDPEQTLCPTTTQEKEFLSEAFKQTPMSPIKRSLTLKNIFNRPARKLCVAGSCLSPIEAKNLKILCHERGWTYLDKYTKDLTHLVVGVDEENKSQRSVKYMCALAASKWIVTYSWVEKCLQSKTLVDELPYEALDACGEPGPRRSRTAMKKVFDGITFYCMPPFSLLDIDTLKQMLVAAGGRVANDPKAVKVTQENCNRPALLLAEPEQTQEDRFVFFAMEHNVVPVNYEWALNCLGAYTLCSILDLLLCPFSILPARYLCKWPAELLKESQEELTESI